MSDENGYSDGPGTLTGRDEAHGTACPYCHQETGVVRTPAPLLLGGLRLEEFRALVRSEWRGKRGSDAWGRAHSEEIASTLVSLVVDPCNPAIREELRDRVWTAVADVLAAGGGRREVRREMAKLVHSIRAVLRDAGVDPRTVREAYVRPARAALDGILDYP